ncbi:MAG: hypothetical protein C6W56_05770 [Caldibacillus debilis]|nr:MAG: hypothetical protein C6W56_05770 [Caldibacillus debilis]
MPDQPKRSLTRALGRALPPALLGWADGAFSAEKTLRNEPEGFADGCRGGKRRPQRLRLGIS